MVTLRLPILTLSTAICLALSTPNLTVAQKAPELGYVFPPSIRIGGETAVTLGGYDFTSDMQFFVHDPLVRLSTDGQPGPHLIPPPPYWFGEKSRATAFPIPREVEGVFTVEPQARPGIVRWQVANANGSAPCAVVYASDVPELIEDRWRDAAQSIPPLKPQVAIGINGRLEKIAEVDRYVLQTMQNGPVTIDLFARRLGSNFHGALEVRDGQGHVIADCADTEGRDAQLTFFAEVGAAYELRLFDIDYRGNRAFVYRLGIQSGPQITATIPATLAAGETRDVTFIGWGLHADGSLKQPKLQTLVQQVIVPSNAKSNWEYSLKTSGGVAKVAFPVTATSELPYQFERDNATADLGHGGAITARLPATDSTKLPTSRFRIECRKGTRYQARASSQSLGGLLDLSLRLEDSEGKTLASNDDANATLVDPKLEFVAKQDGDYFCIVEDLSGRSMAKDSVFHLNVAEVTPDFALTAPQQVHLPIGGKAALKVTVERHAFDGEIALEVDGLPPGITVAKDLKIAAKQKSGSIAFECDAMTAASATVIRVRGRGVIPPPAESDQPEQTLVRELKTIAAGNLAPITDQENYGNAVLLTTTMKPRFKVLLIDRNRQRAVHRGTTYPAPFIIEREEGFSQDVRLMMAARQSRHRQGIRGPVLNVPAAESEALYPCQMPEWLETDRTTRMVVLGAAMDKDPQGNLREVTQPADARITMILEGALLRVAHEAPEMTVTVGEKFVIPFRVSRSKKLPLEVKVELVTPPEISELLIGQPITLSSEQSAAEFPVVSTADPRLSGSWDIALRATAMQHGRWPVVSTTKVTVEFKAE